MIYTIKDIDTAANYILKEIGSAKVVAFQSAMGSGKTTLITAVCKRLGVIENPSSPTFSIINVYETQNGESIYHLDLYRVRHLQEAIEAGVEDAVYSNSYCFIEWPNTIQALLPSDTVYVDIKGINAEQREIVLRNSPSIHE